MIQIEMIRDNCSRKLMTAFFFLLHWLAMQIRKKKFLMNKIEKKCLCSCFTIHNSSF